MAGMKKIVFSACAILGTAALWFFMPRFMVRAETTFAYRFTDQSGTIGTDNWATGVTGPLEVRIKLGQPLGGAASGTLALTLYQYSTSGCMDPAYRMQGYRDGGYQNADGPGYSFVNWTSSSGAPIALSDYSGIIVGTAAGAINPLDYYALTFDSCDASRPVTIAAAPSASYACTRLGGVGNATCYYADVIGAPFMTLTAMSAREPVVIVPGITGSVLARTSDGKEVWPNAGEMMSVAGIGSRDSYLDELALDAQGGQPVAMSTPDIVRAATTTIAFVPVREVFYGNLIDAFVADGYAENKDLFIVPYDWRLDVREAEGALAAKIDSAVAASPTGKINIVAHSMGGVLMKDYLAHRADNSFLDKLVLAGVPQLGSPSAFKILNYGDNLGVAIGSFDILNPGEIKKISQNMPSLYQLLPSPRYADIDGGYVWDFRNGKSTMLGYGETTALMTNNPMDSRNANLLQSAAAFHQGFDTAAVNASSVYNIVGCLRPTLAQFNLYDNGVVDVVRASGDGTVPDVSAMNLADGFHNYFVRGDATGIDHRGLISDPRPLALITNIMDQGTVPDAALPEGVSAALGECTGNGGAPAQGAGSGAEDSFEFVQNGRGELHVYDAQNRHTGPLPDGGAEQAIPGSEYETIGGNSFIIVPASSAHTYKIVSRKTASSPAPDGAATSTVTLKVKGRRGSGMTKEAIYVSVPLAHASSTAELAFSNFDGSLGLVIDSDGDGNGDGTIQPVAVLADPSSTTDVIPPDIVAPAIPAAVAEGSTGTIVFGATDTGSGVATITATLNGDPVANGTLVTFTKMGTNIMVVTAIDNAGNPRTREVNFEVVAASIPPPAPPVPPHASSTTCSAVAHA